MKNAEETNKNIHLRVVNRTILFFIIIMCAVFLSAGRIIYWQGWVYLALSLLLFFGGFVALKDEPELMQERMKPGPGTKWWDRVFFVFFIPSFIAIVLVGCLDTGRFHWSVEMPTALYVLGYLLYAFSFLVSTWAMRVNPFFSSVVRIQPERGHRVVEHGPYRFVRHPGYVGAIATGVGMALMLGSLYALIPAAVMTLALIVRTFLEDNTLQKELPGYSKYVAEVKYRLLPGIW